MELKRILARDSRTANEKAIQLYGKDVLIISSQRMENQTELIVAVDLDVTPVMPVAEPPKATVTQQEDSAAPFVPFSKLFQSASAFAPLPSEKPASEMDQPLVAAVPSPLHAVTVSEVDPEVQAQQQRHEGQRNQEIVELLRLEMAALRKEFSLSRQMMPWQDGLRLSPAIQQLSSAMNEVGMPAGLRALLTDSIQELESVDDAWPVMQSLLVSALNRPAMTPPDAGVHALCGPSGSGKTSMVARLAYAAAHAHGVENQVMISFADQRPGAWAQLQLLAAQSGVACFRAVNSDMLRTLLQELDGKTVWIDTCGVDFAGQAELLQNEHPKVLRHAVLPVDATVTSVQKILQNSASNWSSLMLSKVDEAAYPWALVKGLSDQSLGVSCMAGSTRIEQAPECFDAVRLVQLALTPLLQHVPQMGDVQAALPLMTRDNTTASASTRPARTSRVKKQVTESAVKTLAKPLKRGQKNVLDEDILIPTLMGALPKSSARSKSSHISSLKVAHG